MVRCSHSKRGRWSRALALTLAFFLLLLPSALAANSGRIGSDSLDDQWELATAADDSGHLYVLYPQYRRGPDCATCWLPSMTLVMSRDAGAHWESPRALTPFGSGQIDPQIAVDAADHRTVYAAWLENGNKDVIAAKSTDFGQSWSMVVADRGGLEADRPVLAARGQDVYVGFSRSRRVWMASSHNGGISFETSAVKSDLRLSAALAGAAAVDNDGNVYLAWAGYRLHDDASGRRVQLYVSKAAERGQIFSEPWTTTLMDTSREEAGCSAYHCAWGYLGAQISLASDSAGVLYALWNATSSRNGVERVYFASSTTRGETWSAKSEVSTAAAGVKHVLPVVAAGSAGEVRIAWMDSRQSPEWSTYYRVSTNGGATWSEEASIAVHPLASLFASLP